MMDRNWLIRTTQFQILGPISKEKILEFYKKGALGPDDEICSGNGYWFSIKEKDLIEKYLTGDLPQSFNPISEAPTVVALKAMGDQTSSLNRAVTSKATSPDQTLVLSTSILTDQNGLSSQSEATQVVNLKDLHNTNENEKVPAKSDLEYPDMMVPKKDDLEYPDMLAPKKEDLEYPTLTLDLESSAPVKNQNSMKYPIPSAETLHSESTDPVHLPKDDDLAYPDMMSSANKEFKVDIKSDSGLKLELEDKKPTPHEEATKTQFMATSPGSAKAVLVSSDIQTKKTEEVQAKETARVHVKPQEERKLLSERKKTPAKEVQPSKKAQQTRQNEEKPVAPNLGKRNDTYFFFIIVLLILIILGVLFYYQEILNKPLPV